VRACVEEEEEGARIARQPDGARPPRAQKPGKPPTVPDASPVDARPGPTRLTLQMGEPGPDGGQEEPEHGELLHNVARDGVQAARKLVALGVRLKHRLDEVVVDDDGRLRGGALRRVLLVIAERGGADDELRVDLEAGGGVLQVDNQRPRLHPGRVDGNDDALLEEVGHEVLDVEPGVGLEDGLALLGREVAVALVDEGVEAGEADVGGGGGDLVGGLEGWVGRGVIWG